MKLSSSAPFAVELRDRETREHTVEAQIKIGIPFQIRAMRENRGLTQEALAEKLETTQNTISRLENPKTGKPTIKTLLRIARAFDVGLLVRFVPFGFYGDVIDAMSPTHIEIPAYEEELQDEAEHDKVDQESMTQTATADLGYLFTHGFAPASAFDTDLAAKMNALYAQRGTDAVARIQNYKFGPLNSADVTNTRLEAKSNDSNLLFMPERKQPGLEYNNLNQTGQRALPR